MADFGSGIALDENFDLDVTRKGDIGTVSGSLELEKDLAVRIAEELDTAALGQQFTQRDEEDLRISLAVLIQEDPRIDEVTSLGISQNDDDQFQLDVEINATAGDGPFDLVIPL